MKIRSYQKTGQPKHSQMESLTLGRVPIKGTIENMCGCGWFVTNQIIKVITLNSHCTIETQTHILRPDNVQVSCALLEINQPNCGYCIDKEKKENNEAAT